MEEKFKEEFVNHLKTLIPDKIKKLNLIFPKIQVGYLRFDEFGLDSVYLEQITDSDHNGVILKFKHRNFHYVPKDYIFDGIYYCNDGYYEYRFDKNLELNARYIKGVVIPPNVDNKHKLHLLNVLIEWKKANEILKPQGECILAYQVEKDGKEVKKPYMTIHDVLKDKWRYKIAYDIVENLNLDKEFYFCKCKVNDNEIIKENTTQIVVGDNHYDHKPEDFWHFTN